MEAENKFFEKAMKVAKQLDSGTYVYTPASTDITIRWRKMYGYVPASEQVRYQKKWAEFRAITSRTLDDVEVPICPGVVQWKRWSKS